MEGIKLTALWRFAYHSFIKRKNTIEQWITYRNKQNKKREKANFIARQCSKIGGRQCKENAQYTNIAND